MTIRYANDLLLTDLARRLTNEHKSFQHHLTDGYLDAAFLRCVTMLKQIDGIMEILNDIRFRSGNEAKKRREDHEPNSSNGVSDSDR
jgi:hypothetical protein